MNKNIASKMTIIEHLVELRKRLLWGFLCLLFIFCICFYFADHLFYFLAQPLVNLFDINSKQGFIYTALHEAFFYGTQGCFFLCIIFFFSLDSYSNMEIYCAWII